MAISLNELFRLYFDTHPSHVVFSDAGGSVVYTNGRMAFLGLSIGDNLFDGLRELFEASGIYEGEGKSFIESMRSRISESVFFFREKNGFFLFSGRPISMGEGTVGYFLDVEDVTDTFLAEKMLRKMERINSLVESFSGFLHEISHPLTAIIGYAQLLSHTHGLDDEQREMVKRILGASMDVKSIMDGFTRFIRMEGEEKVVSLKDVIERCAMEFEDEMRRLGIGFKLEDKTRSGPWMKTSPIKLEEIFKNLFANSIHFLSDWDGKKEIRVVLEERGPNILVVFEDTGPGIPREYISRVFDPYFSTREGGKGLGLYIVASIVGGMGGRVDVLSEEGRFTRFIMVLPRGEVERKKQGEDVVAGRRFVVADNEPFFLRTVVGFLKKRGAKEVFGFSDVASLEDFLDKADLFIVSDDLFGRLSSEAVSSLKGRVVLLTRGGSSPVEGVVLLKKPFSLDDLENAVTKALRRG